MNIYRHVASGLFGIPPSVQEHGMGMISLAVEALKSSVRVQVSNVAGFLYTETDKQAWDWQKDFPLAAPPFENIWMEYRLPRQIRLANGSLNTLDREPPTIGALIRSAKGSDGWDVDIALFPASNARESAFYRADHMPVFLGGMLYKASPDGQLLGDWQSASGPSLYAAQEYNEEDDPHVYFEGYELGSLFWVPLLAISFMHCKNVALEERLPPRHEQRQAKRRGEPILKYHEIVIDPAKTQQPSTGAKRHDDKPSKALHIARGHFAHYTADRPLFGKYVGTFWRPAHVRGSADIGTVYKDYKVKAA